ncbi:MAG: NAD-dependent epimerase/dehydratase family protein [Deltaproteobacteria bacterium]|nr:NAD-dependent epimerase/dehydratase family protein [Deltaproteobacteria bacterium]
MKDFNKILSRKDQSIRDVMNIINDSGEVKGSVIVDDDNRLLGVVTDGDIRRAILNKVDLETKIEKIMIKNPYVAKRDVSKREVFNVMKMKVLDFIPILDDSRKVVNVYTIQDLSKFENNIVELNELEDREVKSVLIIGGAGYTGSVLVRALLTEGYKVTVFDNLQFGDNSIRELKNNPNFKFIKGDIRDIQSLLEHIKDFDAVIHLAAIVGDAACNIDPENSETINLMSTRVIAEICKFRKIPRFIFASTCSVYGASDELLNEESEVNPLSIYAETKLKSEQAIQTLADKNFSPCIFRIATVFGPSPRMRFDLVVNLLTAKACKEKKITIFSGEQWRPNIHVEDLARAYIQCLKTPRYKIHNQIFNVGGNDSNYKIIDIGRIIKKLIPDAELIIYDDEFDKRDYKVDFTKIKNILGFEPQKKIEDGVQKIQAMFEQNADLDFTKKIYYNSKSYEIGTLKGLYFEA